MWDHRPDIRAGLYSCKVGSWAASPLDFSNSLDNRHLLQGESLHRASSGMGGWTKWPELSVGIRSTYTFLDQFLLGSLWHYSWLAPKRMLLPVPIPALLLPPSAQHSAPRLLLCPSAVGPTLQVQLPTGFMSWSGSPEIGAFLEAAGRMGRSRQGSKWCQQQQGLMHGLCLPQPSLTGHLHTDPHRAGPW